MRALQGKRQALVEELAAVSATTLSRHLQSSLGASEGKDAAETKASVSSKETVPELSLELRFRQLSEIGNAFRLAGLSIFEMDGGEEGPEGDRDGRLGLRWDTCHEGEYYECYYLLLNQDATTEELVIESHTLPYFLPVRALAARHLNRNIRHFTDAVGAQLNAFVGRRQQAVLLRTAPPAGGHDIVVEASSAFDLVAVNWSASVAGTDLAAMVDIKLVYEDLTATLPTMAVVQRIQQAAEDEDPSRIGEDGLVRKRIPRWERHFLTMPLSRAVETCLSA